LTSGVSEGEWKETVIGEKRVTTKTTIVVDRLSATVTQNMGRTDMYVLDYWKSKYGNFKWASRENSRLVSKVLKVKVHGGRNGQ
jgi:hypothetical protein